MISSRMGCWMSEVRGDYKIIINKSVIQVLRKLPKDLLGRISQAIDDLSNEPRPVGCKKLEGYDNLYRIRVGDWRISYAIEDERLIVLVIEVTPRGGA
jgi:mRNA interferase RelE/StbE